MNTVLPLLILVLGGVLHLTLSQNCTESISLASDEQKTIRTTDTVPFNGLTMSVDGGKLLVCDGFQTVILQVEDTNGMVRQASFPAEGECWDNKNEWKKLRGDVTIDDHKVLNYHLSVDGCIKSVSKESMNFTGFQTLAIVGHGQSYWCLGAEDLPENFKPPPVKCPSSTTLSASTTLTVSRAEVLLAVGWVVGGLVVVVTVVVTVAVVWCVCRWRSSPSLASWKRGRGEQLSCHGHVKETSLNEPFSSFEEGALHVSHNSLYDPCSSATASSGRDGTGRI